MGLYTEKMLQSDRLVVRVFATLGFNKLGGVMGREGWVGWLVGWSVGAYKAVGVVGNKPPTQTSLGVCDV